MDKVPVIGRRGGTRHQGHKSSGRHFQEEGIVPLIQEVAHNLQTEGSALIELLNPRS